AALKSRTFTRDGGDFRALRRRIIESEQSRANFFVWSRTEMDERIPLSEAAEFVATLTGQRPPMATMRRWGRTGVRGIRLRAEKLGSWHFTTPKSVSEFLEELADRRFMVRRPEGARDTRGIRPAAPRCPPGGPQNSHAIGWRTNQRI